jgi:hypothetical protein
MGLKSHPTARMKHEALGRIILSSQENFCWSSSAQSFLIPSSTELTTIFYSLAALGPSELRITNHVPPYVRHGPHRKYHFQQFFYCCVCIRCRTNMFTETLPRNVGGRQIHTVRKVIS